MSASSLSPLNCTDVLSITDLSASEILRVFDTAESLTLNIAPHRKSLDGKAIALLFEKPSLRTRVSLEVGIATLGGIPITLDHGSQRLGQRESVKDYAKNLERWVRSIVARTYAHQTLVDLAASADIPIINALSDLEHPCQALADLLTLRQRLGDLHRVRLAYVGDGNNVCHSLMLACATLGSSITVITPRGHEPREAVATTARHLAGVSGSSVTLTHDIAGVESHHAVYTDAWISMGQDDADGSRLRALTPFQVNAEVMALASRRLEKPALFMHCLPATRGREVTDEVIDSAQSVVYDQAENRMHAQNALLLHLLAAQHG